MLETAKEPIGEIALMYEVMFSVATMNYYLELAEGSGHIEYDTVTRQYQTTNKGRKYLVAYNTLIQLAGEDTNSWTTPTAFQILNDWEIKTDGAQP